MSVMERPGPDLAWWQVGAGEWSPAGDCHSAWVIPWRVGVWLPRCGRCRSAVTQAGLGGGKANRPRRLRSDASRPGGGHGEGEESLSRNRPVSLTGGWGRFHDGGRLGVNQTVTVTGGSGRYHDGGRLGVSQRNHSVTVTDGSWAAWESTSATKRSPWLADRGGRASSSASVAASRHASRCPHCSRTRARHSCGRARCRRAVVDGSLCQRRRCGWAPRGILRAGRARAAAGRARRTTSTTAPAGCGCRARAVLFGDDPRLACGNRLSSASGCVFGWSSTLDPAPLRASSFTRPSLHGNTPP